MKKVTSVASFTVVFAVSALAIADAPAPAASNAPRPIVPPPPFAALPTGATTTPPKEKAPPRIPKTERLDGFYVADPPKNQLRDGKITFVTVFGKEEDAKSYTAGKWFGSFGNGDDTVCFAQPQRFRPRSDEAPSDWNQEVEPTTRIQAPVKPRVPPKKGEKPKPYTTTYGEMEVTAIHLERFFQEEKKARVEVVDAWVDPVTHGVRLIGKATLPLERIGSAWRGVRLYAARGEKVIHVVARRDKPKDAVNVEQPSKALEFRMMNAARQPLMIENPAGDHDQTQCGFAHVTLKAQPGAAETAMFETTTVFVDPPEPKPEKEQEKSDGESMGFIGGSGRGREDEGPVIRVRPFRATVSSTWSSKDTAPVISVSFGWAGREREM